MTEKGTGRRRGERRRVPRGSMTKRSRFRRALRSLNLAGFTIGRKLILSEDGRHVAIAFPNYIRAKRDRFRRPGEVTHQQFWALVAHHKSESAI